MTDIVSHIHLFSNIAFDSGTFRAYYFFKDKYGYDQHYLVHAIHLLTEQFFWMQPMVISILHPHMRIMQIQMVHPTNQISKSTTVTVRQFGKGTCSGNYFKSLAKIKKKTPIEILDKIILSYRFL